MECSRIVLESPITPSTLPTRLVGSLTAEALEKYFRPSGSRYQRRLVLNAAEILLLEELARTKNGDDDRSITSPFALR
jgi:hypothetical protein